MEDNQICESCPQVIWSAVTRNEYEVLLLDVARQIHLLACYEALDVPDWPTRHRDPVGAMHGSSRRSPGHLRPPWFAGATGGAGVAVTDLRRQTVTPGGQVSST